MKVNHLALPCRDVLAAQAFYCRYFGFAPARGDGFLMNPDGFVLVLDPTDEEPVYPRGMHHGFHGHSHAEVRELHARMVAEGVRMTEPLQEAGPMLTFYCLDPEGYSVEVRAMGPIPRL